MVVLHRKSYRANGRAYGFELTFFRVGVNREKVAASDWSVRDIYMAASRAQRHRRRPFLPPRTPQPRRPRRGRRERRNRAHLEWQLADSVSRRRAGTAAVTDNFALQLHLSTKKPPVIHGIDGVSQKSATPGKASQYISLTRLAVTGSLQLDGKTTPATGVAWMDHEFFTEQLDDNESGWDWLSVQLDDDTELMLYRIRRKDGSIDPFSSGTYIDANGKSTHLGLSDFTFMPAGDAGPVRRATRRIRSTGKFRSNRCTWSSTLRPPAEIAGTLQRLPDYSQLLGRRRALQRHPRRRGREGRRVPRTHRYDKTVPRDFES